MTAVQRISPVVSLGRAAAPSVFPNLLAKELRASRRMIFIGLYIFLAMPALILLPCIFFVRGGEWEPLATLVFCFFGWLYAVIVGADVVCRDLGRREGEFLLAQPVSPRLVIGAKLVAGVLTFLAVAIPGLACDAILAGRQEGFAADVLKMVDPVLFYLCVIVICYLLAFGLATLTRQMLTSVLLTLLVLLIWVVAPLVTHRLSWLYPARLLGDKSEAWFGRGFVVAVCVVAAASIVAAMWGVERERRLRIGPKALGWAIALTVTGLFTVAMGEVGNSLPLQSQTWVYQTGADASAPGNPEAVLASGDGWCYLVNSRMPYVRFRLAADGKVSDLHRGGKLQGYPLEARVVDFKGLVLTEVQGGRPRTLARVRVDWPEGQEPREISRCVTQPPDPAAWPILRGAVSTERYGYALYVPSERFRSRDLQSLLCVYEWTDQGHAAINHQAVMPFPSTDYCLPDETQIPFDALTLSGGYVVAPGPLAIRADDPEPALKVLNEGRWTDEESLFKGNPWELLGPFGMGAAVRDVRRGFEVSVGKSELKALPLGTHTGYDDDETAQPIGRYRISPLAQAFRDRPGAVVLQRDTVVELNGSTLTTYDVSDPHRPRRSGFYHLTSPWSQLFVVDDHALVLQENTVLTVLGLPK